MQILFTPKTGKSIERHLKGVGNRIRTPQVGDYLDISSFKTGQEYYVCNTLEETLRQIKRYKKAFGVNWFDILKGCCYHKVEVIPEGMIFAPIHSVERIASVQLKTRSKQNVDAIIDKIDMGKAGPWHEYYYVLKHNDKQIGNLYAIYKPDNKVEIAYLTNVLGRKKYRGTERILVQTLVEDCIKKGFVPNLNAEACDVGSFMGRGYNNLALYRRMGMHSSDEVMIERVVIDSKDVIPIFKKYLARNGEILEGTKSRLDSIQD